MLVVLGSYVRRHADVTPLGMTEYWSALASTPTQLQLGAKEAIINMEFFCLFCLLSPTINLFKGGISGNFFKTNVRKGTKLAQSDRARSRKRARAVRF
jgi:hypothetical protein